MKNRFFFIAAVLVLSLAAGLAARPQAAPPTVIEMTAKMFEYSPSEVKVKKGAHVQLKIVATDKPHGFQVSLYPDGSERTGDPGLKFDPPQNSWRLEKDQEQVIEFNAEKIGTYPFKCSVMCGMGHRDMKGAIIVE